MNTYHTDYDAAHDAAQALANRLSRDAGIERSGRGFIVRLLPDLAHSYGWDLRAERVTPNLS